MWLICKAFGRDSRHFSHDIQLPRIVATSQLREELLLILVVYLRRGGLWDSSMLEVENRCIKLKELPLSRRAATK
jgi:hypothetical protein